MPIPKSLPNPGGKGEGKGATASTSSGSLASRVTAASQVVCRRYSLGEKLGSGNFGTVFLVTDHQTGEKKVLKKINVGEIQPDETVEAVKEATLLAQLDHPAIVKFHDSFMDGDSFCIVTEYCEGGDLDHILKHLKATNKTLDETLILDWFVQLTNAVRYIHDRKVLHRDLKTRNIFLKDNKIKLGDFGISRILIGTSDYATTFTGTPYYMSPEVLKHDGYNSKSDIWSLGAVLYELCTCEHAFQGQNIMAIMYKIVEGHPPRLPNHFTPSLKYLHTRMMDKLPSKRPSAVEILQDPYIKRHMETLSHKLALTLSSTKSNPSEEAKAIAQALNKKHKKSVVDDSDDDDKQEALTPRQKMLHRKTKQAEQQAEKMKQVAAQNFSENQQRRKELKSRKSARIIPPWVQEHPDVFDDPNISITATGVSQESHKLQDSLMELSLRPMESNEPMYTDCPGENVMESSSNIPQDPVAAEKYYSQFNDFEMMSSSYSDEDEYQAILHSINEALHLPEQLQDQPLVPQEKAILPHDEFSPFSPDARERRISQLRSDAERIFGCDVFQQVYKYLKAVRGGEMGTVDEAVVIAKLKSITDNIRDCFLVDQLVFLETQTNDPL